MARLPINPSITLTRFSCPHCGALAHQTWYDVYVDRLDDIPHRPDLANIGQVMTDPNLSEQMRGSLRKYLEMRVRGEVFLESTEKSHYGRPELENVSVSVCYSCERPSLWVHDHLVYPAIVPAGIDPNEDLTDDIKRDFREAAAILNVSPRGTAALLRLCIQKLCVELGEPGKVLNDDIANLVRKRGLDAHVQQALDIVRVVGNNAVHPGQIDLRDDRDTAIKLFELVNEIAEELITRPARIGKLYKAIVPESDQQKIAKRDSK